MSGVEEQPNKAKGQRASSASKDEAVKFLRCVSELVQDHKLQYITTSLAV
jgi:hypothetical protein